MFLWKSDSLPEAGKLTVFGLPASGGNDSYTFFNSPVDQRHRYNEDEITTDDVDAKNLKASKVGVNPSFDASVSSTHHADETAMS